MSGFFSPRLFAGPLENAHAFEAAINAHYDSEIQKLHADFNAYKNEEYRKFEEQAGASRKELETNQKADGSLFPDSEVYQQKVTAIS